MPAQPDVEAVALRSSVFLASAAGLAFIPLRLGLPLSDAVIAALCACAVAAAVPLQARSAGPVAWRAALWLAVVGLFAAWVAALFHPGWLLPPGDPVAVPQLARTVATGSLPTQAFPAGSSGHAYPPGYPILFASATALLSPAAYLLLFKAATLACVALIPAAWAWMHARLFSPQPPLWACTALAYAAFFMAERTLGFVTPFSGNNALLLALLLAPPVTIATLSLTEDARRWPLAVVPIYGLLLIHFSMLQLLAALLGSYVGLALLTRRSSPAQAARVLAVGAAAAALLLVLNRQAMTQMLVGGPAFEPLGGLARLAEIMLSARPPFVIFTDNDFGLAASPFRGLLVLACAAFAGLIGVRLRRPGLWQAAAVYLCAFLVSLAFATGVVPAGVPLDFARWFSWPLQAAVFLCAGVAFVALWGTLHGWRRQWATALAGIALFAGVATLYADGRPERVQFRKGALPKAELDRMLALLPARAGESGCILIGGEPVPGSSVIMQRLPIWTYAEAVSPCRYLNGSWLQLGPPEARAVDGMPSAEAMAALPRSAEIYFIGRPVAFEAFRQRLGPEPRWDWRTVGPAPPDEAVWRAAAR